MNHRWLSLALLVGVTGAALLAMALPGARAHTDRESFATKSLAVPANGDSLISGISADGRFVVFESLASNLVVGDTNNTWDVFMRDRLKKRTESVSVSSSGAQNGEGSHDGVISADGRFVIFDSGEATLVSDDTNDVSDVFVRDRLKKTTERVSVSSSEAQANSSSAAGSISRDGRFVTFSSDASNLVSGDTNGVADTFVRDRIAGTTQRVSISSSGAQGDAESGSGRISADGRFIAFGSTASTLIADDTNGVRDMFLRDRAAETTERIFAHSSGAPSNQIGNAAISGDGRYIAIEVLDNRGAAVYIRDRTKRTPELVSVNDSGRRIAWSRNPAVSGNGRFVVFDTGSFANGDWLDVFVRDRLKKTTEHIIVNNRGGKPNRGNAASGVISANGRFVAFQSNASNLVSGDPNRKTDVFVRDRRAGTTTLVSVGRR